MPGPDEKMRERELAERLEREKKDIEVERTIGPRPLEGLSEAHTSWTQDQDEGHARAVHGRDEERSRRLSESQAEGREEPGPGG